MKTHHNPGPMDAHPGLLDYTPGADFSTLSPMSENGWLQPFGQRLRILRTNAGLSLRDLAKRVEVTFTYISHLENGRREPSHAVLLKIASVLGVHPGELLSGSEGAREKALEYEEAQEARAIVLCLRDALESYESLDPSCPLNAWDSPKPEVTRARTLDHAATRANVDAARRALAKLERGL